ncbi:hypothetical protein SAMN05216378_3665 [Paenibacillus catalpae]|uniref:Uncharacterized protein n=1 Tax=Paenibacillus catalpae TaxID=1045775 RepID=A0A1I2BUK5_9BACL|nr:hypothetical protein SAMN05216378_3665 [Paenibacillus catalpae]
MLASALVLCTASAMAFRELPRLFRQGQGREAVVFLLMLILGVYFSLIAVNELKTPSPLKLIEYIYHPVNQFFSGWF